MKYSIEETNGFAVILDEDRRSIVDILTAQTGRMGEFQVTPVFNPEVAREIVRALDLVEVFKRVSA